MSSRKRLLDCDYVPTRIMLIFFKCLGLAPSSVQKSSECKEFTSEVIQDCASIKFSSSFFGCAYNICLVIAYIGVLFVAVPVQYGVEYPNRSTVTMTLEMSASIFGNGVMIIIWMTLGFRQKTTARLLNQLLNLDGGMAYLNDGDFLESSKSFIFCLCVMNNVTWVGIYSSSSVAFDFPIICYFVFTVTTNILTWFVVQYTLTLKLIEKRFKAINQAVRGRSISSIAEIPYGRARSLAVRQLSTPVIATLRRSYISLCKISSELSDFFSVMILLTIGDLSFMFLYNAYYFVLACIVTMPTQSSPIVLANSLFWLASLALPITTLASGATNTVQESRKTADVVQELLTTSNGNVDDDKELKLFALDLLHRKVQFTACGLFSLERTMLHSIFSMVVTYLVILIQFPLGNSVNTSQQTTLNTTIATSSFSNG